MTDMARTADNKESPAPAEQNRVQNTWLSRRKESRFPSLADLNIKWEFNDGNPAPVETSRSNRPKLCHPLFLCGSDLH
jgi:hypothetical protein